MTGVRAAAQEEEHPDLWARQAIINAPVVNIHPGPDGQLPCREHWQKADALDTPV